MELAEEYFELQDLLTEGDNTPLVTFSKKLEAFQLDVTNSWEKLKQQWDETIPIPESVLREIANLLTREKYIASMAVDIERKLQD